MSTTLFEILEEQMVDASKSGEYTPSNDLKKLVCVSATHPKVVRKNKSKVKRAKCAIQKHKSKKRRRLAK